MFEIELQGGGRIKLSGRLDAAQAERARAALSTVQESATLDLTDLDYVSSAGLGVLVQMFKRLRDSGHTFRLTNLQPRIRSVFVYAGLDKVLSID